MGTRAPGKFSVFVDHLKARIGRGFFPAQKTSTGTKIMPNVDASTQRRPVLILRNSDITAICSPSQPLGIGRDPQNSTGIVLRSDDVSYWHALISYVPKPPFYVIKDMNSSNGTFVNGHQLDAQSVFIKKGDVIQFGTDSANSFVVEGNLPAVR